LLKGILLYSQLAQPEKVASKQSFQTIDSSNRFNDFPIR